jgi:hypothetical protein
VTSQPSAAIDVVLKIVEPVEDQFGAGLLENVKQTLKTEYMELLPAFHIFTGIGKRLRF